MGALEDLVASVLSDSTQQKIAAENQYYGYRDAADTVGEAALRLGATGDYGLGETAVATGLSGLVSGLFGNQGDKYQDILTQRYQQAASGGATDGLPSLLANSANRQNKLFQFALGQDEILRKQELEDKKAILQENFKLDIAKKLVDNPRLAKSPEVKNLLAGLFNQAPSVDVETPPSEAGPTSPVVAVPDATGDVAAPNIPGVSTPETKTPESDISQVALDSLGVEGLSEKMARIAKEQYDASTTLTSNEASDAAQRILSSQIRADATDRAKLNEQSAAFNSTAGLLRETEAAVEGAGQTGGFLGLGGAGIQQAVKVAAGALGSEKAQSEADNAAVLKSKIFEFIRQSRIVGSGAMSDSEMALLAETALKIDRTPSQNRALLNSLKRLHAIDKEYLSFKSQYADKFNTPTGADEVWRTRILPKLGAGEVSTWQEGLLGKKEDKEVGAFSDTNTFELAPQKKNLDSSSGSPLSVEGLIPERTVGAKVMDAAYTGVSQIPAGLVEAGKLAYKGLDVAVRGPASPYAPKTPEEAEAFLTGLGKTAAIVGGATVGSVVPVVGTAAGAGAGAVAFDALKDFVTGDNKGGIPTEEQLLQGVEVGSGALFAPAITKGIGKVAKGTKFISDRTGRVARNSVSGAEENLVGVRKGNVAKNLQNKSYGYLEDIDNGGKLVSVDKIGSADDAVAVQSQLSQSVERVKADGLLKDLTNDVQKNKVIFDAKRATAGKKVNAAHTATENAISNFEKASGVKVKLKADFSPVDEYLNSLKNTSRTTYNSVLREVNAMKKAYSNSDKSYQAIRKLEKDIGSTTNWDTAEDAVKNVNKAKRIIYNSYRDALLKANESAMKVSKEVPSLAEVNKTFSSYENLDKFVTSKAGLGDPSLASIAAGGNILQSILQAPDKFLNLMPKSAITFNKGVSKIVNPTTKGISGISGTIGLLDEIPGSVTGAGIANQQGLFSSAEPKKKVNNPVSDVVSAENINPVSYNLEQYGITDPVERAQFLGQLDHESMGFKALEEKASGAAYEGRVKDLGNTEKGDGKRFKGRGYIQLTGRANYKKYGDMIGEDLISNPELAAQPDIAMKLAIAYWNDRVKPNVDDFSDTKKVTKLINGGYNGLLDRIKKVRKYSQA